MENQLSIALSKNKLLKNVDISSLNLAGVKGKLITAGEGEILYREGDHSNTIYLVVSGEVNVIKKRLLGKTKSYIFLKDDFFGNEEYFEETSRTSTAVALRDSYLIALGSDEIESLVNQEHQIYLNLREPAEEADETLQKRENVNADENLEFDEDASSLQEKLDSDAERTGTAEDTQKSDEDFFKSIVDAGKVDENKIFQKEIDTSIEGSKDDFELLSFDAEDEAIPEFPDEKNILDENGIPKPEFEMPGNRETLVNEPVDIDQSFDDSAFLNEDGIPKAEFEMPEKRPTHELDDALFSILAGEEIQKEMPQDDNDLPEIPEKKFVFENNDKKENTIINQSDDDGFFAALSDDKHEIYGNEGKINPDELGFVEKEKIIPKAFDHLEKPEDFKSQADIKTPAEVRAKQKPDEEVENVKAHPYKKHFDNDDILAEADAQLRKIERGEKVTISDNWRTISDAGGEMTPDQLQMIINAAELVNSTVKLDEVLTNVVQVATSLTQSDRGTLFIIDREKNELWSLVAMGNESKEIRLKLGDGLAGYVAQSGEVVNIKDAQTDPRFRSDFDKASGYKTKSMLCYPIKNNKSEIIGVLQLLNSKNGEYSKLDENFLNAISINSAIALQNAAMVDKLLQTERVHSLGKMANFLIQDIKKPVLVSRRYAEHLKSKNLTQDVAQIVDMLLEQLSQVADLVQTTSSYSEGKPMLRTLNVSLNNTVADYIVRMSSYVDSRNCKIAAEYDKDVTVKLDVKEFYQCFVHIVKNACDAMPEGGEINISTKRDDRRVKLLFKDNGLGIPDGFKEKIFEPFMSYGKKEGTGLGLSITKKVVEAHNATIEVQSSLGQGATFVITLPIIAAF